MGHYVKSSILHHSSPKYYACMPLRPPQYKHWAQENMHAAMRAVIEESKSVREAAQQYDVPKSTLGDRVSGRVLPGATSGPPTYLTSDEEKELVSFLCRVSEIGHGRTRQEVIAIVERALASRGNSRKVSSGWWSSFISRHPEIVLRTPATLSLARASASDRCVLDNYFDELESTLTENDLLDSPCLIFNMDETGMPFDPCPLKVVTWKGHKNPSQVSSGVKSQVTVVACVSAGGQCLPPMVIWDRKMLPPELAVGEVPGTIYGLSDKGWIDQQLFDMWFHMHFLRYAPPTRPLLLLMDGHSSHYCPETIRSAAQERVILFSLPPNTTHLTQPLDKAVFGPLKMFWRQACHNFIVKNPGVRISKHNFSSVFGEAWIQAMTPKNILAGFHTTGIYPPDRNAIKLPGESVPSLALKTGIAYIPLYTPAKRRVSHPGIRNVTFTEEEEDDFRLCYEEGGHYNFGSRRYQQWLKVNHPTSPCDSPVSVYKPMEKHSSIRPLLNSPTIPQRSRVTNRNGSVRVLTSAENLKRIDEKEKEKQRKIHEKEERARSRKAKQLQKSSRQKNVSTKATSFSDNEFVLFSQRYENGYDITTDERYNAWVEAYHPKASVSAPTQRQVVLSDDGSENGKSLCKHYIFLLTA